MAALFDEHPYISRYSLFCDKAGLTPERAWGKYTDRQQIGLDLERPVLEIWAKREGLEARHNTKAMIHSEFQGLAATPDGLIVRDTSPPDSPCSKFMYVATADVKTVRPHERKQWLHGIPRHYYWQVQQQTLCANTSHGYLIALFGVDEIAATRIEADKEAHARIISEAAIFWRQVRGELPPPEPDDHKATLAAMMAKERTRTTIELDLDAAQISDALKNAQQKKSIAERDIKRLKSAILKKLGGADCGVWPDGSGYRVETVARAGYTTEATQFKQLTRFTGEQTEEGGEDGE